MFVASQPQRQRRSVSVADACAAALKSLRHATAVVQTRAVLGQIRLRLIAAWQSSELDRQLAAGVDPQRNALLAVRARKLTGRRSRKCLAAGLGRAHHRAESHTWLTAAVRANARELLAAKTVLAAIDRRLSSPAPVGAEGVAMLHALLTDVASPLFQPGEPGALASRLRGAAAALEPTDSG